MFSLISIASASDSANDNLATHDTNQDNINVDTSQNSLSDTNTKTIKTISSTDKQKEKLEISDDTSKDDKSESSTQIIKKEDNNKTSENVTKISKNMLKSSNKSKLKSEFVTINPENLDEKIPYGMLDDSYDNTELIFTGTFENVYLMFSECNSINLTGHNAIFKNSGIFIYESTNIKITDITFIADSDFTKTYGTLISSSDSENTIIENNTITYNAYDDTMNSNAILLTSSNGAQIINNKINYTGKLGEFTEAIATHIVNSVEIIIKNNIINATVPSRHIDWNSNYIPTELSSAGIFLKSCENVIFEDNNITVNYNQNDDSTDDTLCAVIMYGPESPKSDAKITGNNITINGHNFAYGLHLNQYENIEISNNNIITKSEGVLANALELYPKFASIKIDNNNLTATASDIVYPINLGDTAFSTSANVTNNNINGQADVVYGVYIEGFNDIISNNNITVKGNYPIGIMSYKTNVVIKNNDITADGTNTGNHQRQDINVPLETLSICIADTVGNAKIEITNNTLTSNGEYTIDTLKVKVGTPVKDNNLTSTKGQGDITIHNDTELELVGNNNPVILYSGIVYVQEGASDDNEGSQSAPVGSIAKAIKIASSETSSKKIIILTGTYREHDLEISADLNITGNGDVVLDAQKLGRLFNVANHTKLLLNNLKLINGKTEDGGAIFTNDGSSLEINNTIFENNTSTRNGGAVYLDTNTDTIITESAFINNNATLFGGAIYVKIKSQYEEYAKLNVTKSSFTNNTAGKGYNSGAICTDGITNINYCIFLRNDENGLIFSYNLDYKLNATYNWWGTNNPDFNSLVEGYYYEGSWEEDYFDSEEAEIDTSNWIIMSVTPNTIETMNGGETKEISVDFNHYNDSKGNIGDLTTIIPELTVTTTGSLSPNKTITENNIAIFTYTAPSTGSEDTISFKSGNQTIPITITLNNENLPDPTPYTGIVYVSKEGNDVNNGSETNPVASITKAVEIATSETGSKQIIILNGTYVESGVKIQSDLNITGKGIVTWNANATQAFRMYSGNVNINNIKFINGNDTSYGHLFRVDGGEISIDNCKFVSNGGKVSGTNGVIYVENANFKLTNSIFEKNTASPTGTSYGIICVKNTLLYVDNCNFTNNHNKYGVFHISYSVATIKNSKFIGNNATSSSGGQGAAIYLSGNSNKQSILRVENCDFINNSAKYGTYTDIGDYHSNSTSGQGGAIYVNNNATLIVLKSKFINNSALASPIRADGEVGGGAIFACGGNVTVIESLFENNFAEYGSEIYMQNNIYMNGQLHLLNVTKSIFNSASTSKLIESNYTNGKLFAIGNTWVNTEDPSTRVSEGIIIVDLTPQPVIKVDPTITIKTDSPILEGQNLTITITTGNATGNITVTVKNTTATIKSETVNITKGTASLIIQDLAIGTYNVTINYNGDDKYNTKTEDITVKVDNVTTLINDLRAIISKLEHDLDNNVTALNESLDTISDIQEGLGANNTIELLNTISKLQETLDSNSTNLTDALDIISSLKEKLGNDTKLSEVLGIIDNLQSSLKTNVTALSDAEKTIRNNTEKISNLSDTLNEKTSQINELNSTIQNQTKTITTKDDTIQTQSQIIADTNNKLSNTQKQLAQATVQLKTVKAAKKVKKSKKYTITVKLKKAVKGRKVFVIFNGKTYTKKTNKKGITKITIKASIMKKLAGKKVKYQVIFGEKIVKKYVKVKK